MATLAVVVQDDTFASVWSDLAARHGLELWVVPAVDAVPPGVALVGPLLVVAGREDEGEADVRALKAAGFPTPVVLGSLADHRLCVRLLRAGASDYVSLPADLPILESTVAGQVERLRGEVARSAHAEAARSEYDFSQIVGNSPSLREALGRAARVIPFDRAGVLITGETGTGKELVARAIHFNGPRARGGFIEINCAAIPANLLESELFGYERGAFTDARAAKPGLFEAAVGGTLFLDEIGHLALETQGKILKALEEKRIRRLGSVETREVDVRIIAATHVKLEQAVEAGEFREDLYYRLAVIPIHLPPLRERGDDVLLIADHFLRTLAEQYGLPKPQLDDGLRTALLSHTWPGNVRELRNSLERALLLGGGKLSAADLFMGGRSAPPSSSGLPFPATMEVIEKEAARRMVARFAGNKSAAAAVLKISRSRLYRLLDEEEPTEAGESGNQVAI